MPVPLRPLWADLLSGDALPEGAPGYLKAAGRLLAEHDLTEKERRKISEAELTEEDRKGQLAYAYDEGVGYGMERGMASRLPELT